MTEREKIDHSRACFILGARAHGASMEYAQNLAALTFPYPKVTRERVITLSNGGLRIIRGGMIYYATNRDSVTRGQEPNWHQTSLTAQDALDLAALALNPTEEVDA